MNIIHYQGNDYFDYARYWIASTVNCFIGRHKTGKTYSLDKAGVLEDEYDYIQNAFLLTKGNKFCKFSVEEVFYRGGIILSFITMHDYYKWESELMRYAHCLDKMLSTCVIQRYR